MVQLAVSLTDVSVAYGERLLFHIPHLSIYQGDVIGIIGDNGVGKTTLMQLIQGEKAPDQGKIERDLPFRYLGQISEMNESVDQKIDYQLAQYFDLGRLTSGVKSGGECQKYRLAQVLAKGDLGLILDEPSNHLDQKGKEQLIEALRYYPGTLLLVSHDRYLLNHLAQQIWAIDQQEVREYLGNYQEYVRQKSLEEMTHANAYQQFVKERERLERIREKKKEQAEKVGRISRASLKKSISPGRLSASKDKQTVQKSMEKAVKNVDKRLEHLTVVEKEIEKPPLVFPKAQYLELHHPYPILTHQLTLAIGERELIKEASFQLGKEDHVALVGGNGVGKTTLLNYIRDRGSKMEIASKVIFSVYEQNAYAKDIQVGALESLKAISSYPQSFLVAILQHLGLSGRRLTIPVNDLSGGERTRLALAKTFVKAANVILLDEPTNFIDLSTILTLEELIQAYPGLVIFTSHDKEFVQHCATRILTIDQGQVKSEWLD